MVWSVATPCLQAVHEQGIMERRKHVQLLGSCTPPSLFLLSRPFTDTRSRQEMLGLLAKFSAPKLTAKGLRFILCHGSFPCSLSGSVPSSLSGFRHVAELQMRHCFLVSVILFTIRGRQGSRTSYQKGLDLRMAVCFKCEKVVPKFI